MSEDNKLDQILRLYSNDWSYAAIAAQVGLGKNQVAGLINRARKAGRKLERTKPQPANLSASKVVPSKGGKAKASPAPAPALAVAISNGRVTPSGIKPQAPAAAAVAALAKKPIDLIGGGCRFPIGDPREPDFHSCGKAPQERSVYCARHHSACYQQTKPATERDHWGE